MATPRTARSGGAQKVDGAQSALLVGPSGHPLPLDIDETLLVRDLNSTTELLSTDTNQLLSQLVSEQKAIQRQLTLLRHSRLGVDVAVASEPDPTWQVRYTTPIQVPGTSTTVYAAADAIGTPFIVPRLGGPNNCVIFVDILAKFDVAPTTTNVGVSLAFFHGSVAAGTDSSQVAITDAELMAAIGQWRINVPSTDATWANNALANSVNGPAMGARAIPTHTDGSLTVQAFCNTGFTLGAAGSLYIQFIYRWANFPGVA